MKPAATRLVALVLTVSLAACDGGVAVDEPPSTDAAIDVAVTTTASPAPRTTVTSSTTLPTSTTAATSPPATASTSELTGAGSVLDQSDAAGLLWMREEEKLARDVYLALFETWDLPIFANIASAEQTHTDAVAGLLDRYGLPDPMAVDTTGVFEDPQIQALYDRFVEQGSRSLADALVVGATIEDLDIVDLRLRESALAAIDDVYARLERGSRNHLRAFVSTLQRQGGDYSPEYLTPEEYEAIVSSPRERGRAGR